LEPSNVEVGATFDDQVGNQFTDGAREFEAMTRAGTDDPHLPELRVPIYQEVIVRRICIQAHARPTPTVFQIR
jgi:hypothetical protein